MKKTLSNYYLGILLIFIAISVVFNVVILRSSEHMLLDSSTKDIQENIINNYKDELKNRIEIVEKFIEQKQKNVRTKLKNDIRSRVNEAYGLASKIYKEYKGKKSDKEIKKMILAALRDIRFNDGRGYFFIDDTSGNCVLYPLRPELEGKNILHLQDSNKKYVINDIVNLASTQSEGFISYFTYRYKYEKDDKRYEKITYVKSFEPFHWVIGTGEYLMDIENEVKKDIANIVNAIKIANNTSYIQIYEIHNFAGGDDFATMVANANRPDLCGEKISSNVVDSDGKPYRQEILNIVNQQKEGFVTYKYQKLNSKDISDKIVYVKKIPYWNWVLATGEYLDKLDIVTQNNIQKLRQGQDKNRKLTWIFVIGLFVILLLLSLLISKKIAFESGKITEFFKRAASKKEHIDIEKFKIDEFKSLASFANEMVQTIQKEQYKLESLNAQLEINIQEKTLELKALNTYLQEKNQELEEHYYTDSLTTLYNRNKFVDDLKTCNGITIALFDIDGFKNINDFYGTKVGDDLLKSLALVLHDFAQKNDAFAYRLSSDEFLLCFEEKNVDTVVTKCQSFSQNLSQKSFYDESKKIRLSTSMTFAIATGSENVLEKADLALTYARTNNMPFAIFNEENPHMNTYRHKMYWREKIQWAIDNNLIEPFFQPIVNIQNKNERKFEALMRIIDGDEIISPAMFLEIAKETKQYTALSRTMILKTFQKFANCECEFSINIAMEDIKNEETIQYLKDMVVKYGVGRRLILEILETEDIISSAKFMPFVEEMRNLGLRFAIDDFGSGYSNFGVLVKMSPKFLKIDGDLVKEIHKNEKSYHIVHTIVNFAEHIGATVIAEFVENEQLANLLAQMGVKHMQGYHFAPPTKELEW